MIDVFISSGQIISSLGFSTPENFSRIKNKETGIKLISDPDISTVPFFASCVDSSEINKQFDNQENKGNFTRLEKMLILSVSFSLLNSDIDLKNKDTLLVITTTKGNIELLEKKYQDAFPPNRVYLNEMAAVLQNQFSAFHKPIIVCNACISGVSGIITAARLIRMGKYKHIVVTGGDSVSGFTVSGFQSFKAIGSSPCKPYDAERDGLSLGEGTASVLLSSDKNRTEQKIKVKVGGGATTNDANHISGPSRSGDGLFYAIEKALAESRLPAHEIDYISAHGTATPYNDEMECKAIHSAGLESVPVNSFKGAIGHTLGAAGIIETVLTIESLIQNTLLPSIGYSLPGVSKPLNVIEKTIQKNLKHALKTASGFGGCNAAILFSKSDGK